MRKDAVAGGITTGRHGGVLVLGPDGQPLLEEVPLYEGSSLGVVEVALKWFPLLAWWRFRRRLGPWAWASGDTLPSEERWTTLQGPGGNPLVEVTESPAGEGVIDGEVRIADGAAGDWVRWRIKARPGERFLGFGERFNAVDQTGNKLFVWTEEGALGLGEKWGRRLDGVSWNPFPNGPTTAYKPMPFFISSRGYGLLLDTTARVEYDVAATDPGVVDITVWDREFRWVLFYGPEPARIVERFTERTGRATVPAKWVFAPWNDAVYNSENVRSIARKLRQNKIPTTAIWSEDWQGGYWLAPLGRKKKAPYLIFPMRYEVDRSLYPDAEELARELHDDGFRWLSYFFPYILRRSKEYREAKEKGYLLKNRRGGVSIVMIQQLPYGHIDLTNPEAREWYMGLLEENVKVGFDGWMADFGEYVPPGSVTSTGETGLIHHNRFPLLWQEMHRELFDRLRPDGDYVFFCRSAGVGSQRHVPVFWSGDSNTDFERYDGLPSNIPAALSAGLSGLSIWAADIGGYMSLTTRGRDKELFFRWTEFAALLPVMRTHHGTHPGRAWSFDSDEETLEMFATYCRLHTALFPYIYGLAHQASASGMPVVRHLILQYPDDPGSWEVEDEFLLGDRLLVAPVIRRGARDRTVYFPPGEWVDYWTGETYKGPHSDSIASPLDHVPLFVRSGSILPTLDMPVDTLAPAPENSGVVGEDEALGTLRLTMYGQGEDRLTLWDGTQVRMWRSAGGDDLSRAGGVVEVTGGKREGEAAAEYLQPVEMRREASLALSVAGGEAGVGVTDSDGTKLAGAEVSGSRRKRITFEWR
ncbi:MAG: hypothetical protein KKB90_07355 [Actinobacteria bacterium]|nr:hypothetical protein [Actinomycetota bacterium]MCG2818894.1 hypothetical protein [Actinomycetes bacterium]MBU4218767.1 hypothetical protein [Actinomycetota bacterium]MBU4357798.1 hypothetical protein [Actinomycetota bacterium]MBU4390885.1 hypothetical protein [Actinomycetota bacterium]